MPAKPTRSAQVESPTFWDFDLTKKIISGLLFFLGSLACVYLLIPFFRSDLKTAAELILPGVIVLLSALVIFQLSRRKSSFVIVLLALAFLGILAGWGLRAYGDLRAAQKITVLVFKFDGEKEQAALREQVLAEIKTAAKDLPDVEIINSSELVTKEQGSTYARLLGEKAQADLVVWAWYRTSLAPRINLFVEDVTPAVLSMPQPADPALPEPIVAYLASFAIRRSFTAQTDTFQTLMSGLLNYKSGNYQAFLDDSEKILAKKDVSMLVVPFDLIFYVGVSHTVRGETQLALDAYNRALKADRKGAAAYNNRALAYVEMKQYGLAIKDCVTALVIDGQYIMPFNTRGMAYLGQGEYDLAIKDFNDVIARDPGDPRGYHNRALAFQALGKTDFAAADFKKEAELRENR